MLTELLGLAYGTAMKATRKFAGGERNNRISYAS